MRFRLPRRIAPVNRWEPFSNGELIDLLKNLRIGRATRIHMGGYEGKLVVHRDIEQELKRRRAYPIGVHDQ
jgi:hypothetical protein